MNYASASVFLDFIRTMTCPEPLVAWIQLRKVEMQQFVSVWVSKEGSCLLIKNKLRPQTHMTQQMCAFPFRKDSCVPPL